MAHDIYEKGNSLRAIVPDSKTYYAITTWREEKGLQPVTHYEMKWNIKGKSVDLYLYTADAYGAVMEMELLKIVTVHLN